MNIVVFDIETVPDTEYGRKLFNAIPDKEIAELMFKSRLDETEGKTEILKHFQQKVVAISSVINSNGKMKVGSLCENNSSEKEIISKLFEIIDKLSPTLVTWNGNNFDLPVIHYRALFYGVQSKIYWNTKDNNKWNNYLSRYHDKHTDLMDVIAGYNNQAFSKLDHISKFIGLPGKMVMEGNEVWKEYFNGNIEKIRNYCEIDVINTYLIYLRFLLIKCEITHQTLKLEVEKLISYLKNENKNHFNDFINEFCVKNFLV